MLARVQSRHTTGLTQAEPTPTGRDDRAAWCASWVGKVTPG